MKQANISDFSGTSIEEISDKFKQVVAAGKGKNNKQTKK
jgi:hypothetical protein